MMFKYWLNAEEIPDLRLCGSLGACLVFMDQVTALKFLYSIGTYQMLPMDSVRL